MAEKKSILLRIPPDLSDALSRWAADELRSLNGQIEFILREAVRRRASRLTVVSWSDVQPWIGRLIAALGESVPAPFTERLRRIGELDHLDAAAVTELRTTITILFEQAPNLPPDAQIIIRSLERILKRPEGE